MRLGRSGTPGGLAKGAGAVAGAVALGLFPASAEASATAQTASTEPSPYGRLGGYFGIAAVVNRFSDQIIKNPVLNKNPALKEWNKTQAEARLPGLKFGRTLWIAGSGRRTVCVHRLATERGSR